MPRNGSGSFSLVAGNPVTPGTVISSTTHNNTNNDIASALTQSIAYDGQTVPIGNLPMGGFKHTNAAPGSAPTDYATYGQLLNSQGLSSITFSSGINNNATPNTKYDVVAGSIVLTNNITTVTRTPGSGGTITNDLALAGPVANGRDQAGAFPINSWVYLYFIWNGTTVATITSLNNSVQGGAPTLPVGYTHWCFVTTLRVDGSGNLLRQRLRGSHVYYELDSGSNVTRLVSNGIATTFTTLSGTNVIPPIALTGVFYTQFFAVHNVANTQFLISLRPFGSSFITAFGQIPVNFLNQVANQGMYGTGFIEVGLAGQGIDYKIGLVPNGSGGATIDVWGYSIPNGDV